MRALSASLLAVALLCACGRPSDTGDKTSALALRQGAFAEPGWCSELRGKMPGEVSAKLPPLTGRVVDSADLLPVAAESELTQRLAALERHTSDQLVVVSLESLGGCTIDEAALQLGNGWGVGQKNEDNGVLLITAPMERKVRIEVGRGLVRRLTNEEASRIINQEILPHIREGDMVQGIMKGVDGILAVLDPASSRGPVSK